MIEIDRARSELERQRDECVAEMERLQAQVAALETAISVLKRAALREEAEALVRDLSYREVVDILWAEVLTPGVTLSTAEVRRQLDVKAPRSDGWTSAAFNNLRRGQDFIASFESPRRGVWRRAATRDEA